MSRRRSREGDDLAAFLRSRREGMPAWPRARSRTPGWRREDIAAHASISVDYYTRLEQGRAASMPSPTVVDALADTLTLTAAERAHLHRLTGRAAPETSRSESPAPALVFILNRLGGTPAQIIDDLGTILAQNPAADALFPWVVDDGLGRANVYERWFCHEDVRAVFPADRRDDYSKAQAGEVRAAAGRRTLAGDDRGHIFVADLTARSTEFTRAWQAHRIHDGNDKRIWLPNADGSGLLAHITVDDHTSQRLIAFETAKTTA